MKETNAALAKKPSTDLMLEEEENQQQQQKTRQGDVTVVKIKAAIKAFDHNIARLEAKLSFLIKPYDPHRDLLSQYEKKIATVKQEIEYAMEERRRLNRLRQMGVIRYSTPQKFTNVNGYTIRYLDYEPPDSNNNNK